MNSTFSTLDGVELEEVAPYLEGLQATKFLAVACFGLLVYDYFLTLDQEVYKLSPSTLKSCAECTPEAQRILARPLDFDKRVVFPGSCFAN